MKYLKYLSFLVNWRFRYNISMIQNTQQQELFQTASRKKLQTANYGASGSKHKDRVIVHESCKKRQSNRRSLRRKIAEIQFYGAPRRNKKKNACQNANQKQINVQIVKNAQEYSQTLVKNDQVIEEITKKIINMHQALAKAKQVKQKSRQMFLEKKELARQVNLQLSRTKEQCLTIKNQIDNMHFDKKKALFSVASSQFQLNKALQKNQVLIQQKNKELEDCLQQFQNRTEQYALNEMRSHDLARQLTELEHRSKKIRVNYMIEQSQLFVLKLQLSNNIMVGMQASTTGIEKRVLLDRDYQNWQRNKQKKIGEGDLKRWVLMQMYRGWKNVIRKLSYQSSQYQVLFGELNNEPVLDELRRLLSQDKMRASYRKFQKCLIFYSQVKTLQKDEDYRNELISSLKNFNNGLIHITQVQFVDFEGQAQLQVHYTYLQCEQLVQKFTYEFHTQLNKQKIIRDLKNADNRRIFCSIEIPLVAHKDDIARYDQIYEIVRKRKNNNSVLLANSSMIGGNSFVSGVSSQRSQSK